jgi:hypothetical protein
MNLSTPIDTRLPFIAYGSFKPFELRYNLIKDYIQDYKEIEIIGLMEEKDGIPIFGLSRYYCFTYVAFILNFKVGMEDIAYQKISENEPDTYYEWGIIDNKNILLGKEGLKGKNEFLEPSWTFREDQYFDYGLKACDSISKSDIIDATNALERDYFPFFKASAAYMLLWTIIERFCTLKYGNIGPSQKIKCLTADLDIDWKIIINKIDRTDTIYRSDKLNEALVLNKSKGAKRMLEYYYGIRSNMVHRGKDVFSDTEKVANSFFELKSIFEKILDAHGYYEKNHINSVFKDTDHGNNK